MLKFLCSSSRFSIGTFDFYSIHKLSLSFFHYYGIRNPHILFVPQLNKSEFEKSLMYQCVKFYNKLPEGIKSLNISRPHKAVNNLLVNRCCYSEEENLNAIL